MEGRERDTMEKRKTNVVTIGKMSVESDIS